MSGEEQNVRGRPYGERRWQGNNQSFRDVENARMVLLEVLALIKSDCGVDFGEKFVEPVQKAMTFMELRMVMDGLMVIAKMYDLTEYQSLSVKPKSKSQPQPQPEGTHPVSTPAMPTPQTPAPEPPIQAAPIPEMPAQNPDQQIVQPQQAVQPQSSGNA